MKLTKIHAVKVTVSTTDSIFNADTIYDVLKSIENREGFLGFTKINFEVDKLPEISYIEKSKVKHEKKYPNVLTAMVSLDQVL